MLVDCLVGLALLGGLLACLVVDGLGRSLVDRRLLQLTINLELPSPGVEQPTQNWYGQGESDCLIKT